MMAHSQNLEVPELGEELEYHCFIAFSFKDEKFADDIAKYLRKLKFKVAICKEFALGNALIDNIGRCVSKSRRAVVLMSKHYLESEYYEHETLLFIHNNNSHKRQLIIPVCLGLTEEEMKSSRLGVYSYQYVNYKGSEIDNNRIAQAVRGPDVPLDVSLPCGNVAQGLVWSYYYGYLRLILNGLEERCKNSPLSKDELIPLIPVVFILIPDNGLCPDRLTECDSRITHVGQLEPFSCDRAGVCHREYKNTIYLVEGPNGEKYYVPCEYATPVLCMYEMCQEGIAGLPENEKRHQIRNFKNLLDQVLVHSKVSDKLQVFKIIFYKAGDDGKADVSSLIAEAIKQWKIDQEWEREYIERYYAI